MLGAPLALAAMGGLLSERSGVIDIALEGKMLASACAGAAAANATNSAWPGLAAGVAVGVTLSIVHWLLTQKYRIDHVVSGMALNAMALGGTNFVNTKFLSDASELPAFWRWHFVLSGTDAYLSAYVVAAIGLPFAIAPYLRRTRGGLRLMAVGNSPSKARLAGIGPEKVRLLALTATGVLTGLAGLLIVESSGRFVDNMTAGRGYIALAAVIIGGWRPVQALVACLVFGAFDAMQIALQGVTVFGMQLPSQLWQSMPYVVAVLTLAGLVRNSRAPYGLGQP